MFTVALVHGIVINKTDFAAMINSKFTCLVAFSFSFFQDPYTQHGLIAQVAQNEKTKQSL